MAIQTATNPQTGGRVALVGNEWQPIAQTATNKTGAKAYLVGDQWVVDDAPIVKAAQVIEPEAKPSLGSPMETGVKEILAAAQPASKPAPVVAKPQIAPVGGLEAKLAAQEAKRAQFAPGEELAKGVTKAALYDLPSMWEQVGVMKDTAIALNVKQRMDLFDKIDKGEITNNDQLRGLDITTGQARSYLASPPEIRDKLKGRLISELANRKDFVKASIDTINEYKKQSKQYDPRVKKASEIGSVADLTNFVANNVGSGAVQLVPLMLAAATTGGVGLGVMGVGMGTSEAIGNRLEFLEKKLTQLPQDQRADAVIDYLEKTGGTTLAVGIVSGALDAVLGPSAKLVKQLASQSLKSETRKAAVNTAIKAVPKTIAGEAVTGGAQEAAQIAGKVQLGERDKFATKQTLVDILDASAAEAAGSLAGAGVNVSTAALRAEGAQQEGTKTEKERIEPTFETPPSTAVQADQIRAEKITALTQVLEQQGIPADNAERIATRRVDAELKTENRVAAVKLPEGRVEQITQDLIAAGVPPQQAKLDAQNLAQEEAEADALAQAETGESTNVAEPIQEPVGASASVAEQPDTGLPTGGVAEPDARGVVPAEQDVAGANVGEGVESAALTTKEQIAATGRFTDPSGNNGKPWTYFYPGAEVTQERYFGAPAKVVEVVPRLQDPQGGTDYKLEVDVSNHPDGYDENGDRVATKTILVSDAELNQFNPATLTETEGTTTDGITTTETQQATQEEQAPPAAGGVAKGRVGRPPVQQRHAVVKTPEGKFEHVTDGEVTATYANNKQATAAVNLAKAQDANNPVKILKFQTELNDALAAKGKGRPVKPPVADGTVELDNDTRQEMEALESALKAYNSPGSRDKIQGAAEYINDAAVDKTAPEAVQQRAQQMLENDVDPKDIPKKLKSTDGNVGKGDTGFNSAANGAQAITRVIKTGNAFQRFVGERIRNFLSGVKFVVLEKGDTIPARMEGARGLFVYDPKTKERTVYVRGASFGGMQGINNITVLHEMLHAATTNRITAGLLNNFRNAQLQKFVREMSDIMKRAEQEYKDLTYLDMVDEGVNDVVSRTYDPKTDSYDIFTSPYEFLAYGMSSPEFQKFLMSVKGVRKEPTLFSAFANSIRDLFGIKQGEATAFSDLVDITDKMLSTRVTPTTAQGKISLQQKGKGEDKPNPLDLFDETADTDEKKELRTARQVDKDRIKAEITYAQSEKSQETKNAGLLQKIRNPDDAVILVKGAWKKMTRAQRAVTTRLPSWDFLARWTKEELPHVRRALDLYNDMKGMSRTLLAATEDRIRITRNAFKADKTLQKRLTRMIYETTDAEYDPSDTTNKVRNKTFDGRYAELGAKNQALYKMWRTQYEDLGDLYIELLDDQVRNIQGLTAEAKEKLTSVIRQTYETKNRIKPFFPFVRDEGDFWLSVGRPNSATRAFYIYESATDRDLDAARIARERNESVESMKDSGEMGMGNNIDSLRNTAKDSSKLLTAVFDAIDAIKTPTEGTENFTAEYKETLKDSVYQVFLATMPEQSFRQMFRHRKGRGGYRTDLIQNVAKTSIKMSTQLARLKYGQQLRSVTSSARDSITGREELEPFVAELERRVANVLSPKPLNNWDAIGGAANKLTYLVMLTSASTALLQPLSLYISALPILSVNHGFSPVKAAKELSKMLVYLNQYGVIKENSDGTHRYVAPSIENAPNLPADEKRAIQAMSRLNIGQSTYVAEVFGYGEPSAVELDSVVGKGKEAASILVGGLMHNMERLTREIVYLASYRLGRERGLTEEAAIRQAAGDVTEALGNYDLENKPRWMQRGLGRVAFALKTYPVIMLQQVYGNLLMSLPFFNKEGKKEALAKAIGIFVTAGSLLGLAGVPAFSILIHAIVAGLKDAGDDDELPEELKDLDPEVWFRTVYMPKKFGAYSIGDVPLDEWIMDGPLDAVSGWRISSRGGLNDIWAKDGKTTKDVKEAAAAFVAAYFGGPTLSYATSIAESIEHYMLGDYEKAREKVLPKPIKDILVAQKYDLEGIKSSAGTMLLERKNVKTSEIVGQALGFAPALTGTVKDVGFKLLATEQEIINKRTKILNMLDIQRRKETESGDNKFEDLLNTEVQKFNKQYPDYQLKMADIMKSLKIREKQREGAPAGVTATKKLRGVADEAIDNLESRLERREKEMQKNRDIEAMNKVLLENMAPQKNPR